MQLIQVDLTNYCCHEYKSVVFDSGFVGLVGGNGTGKSSILDAVRYALVGQSVNDGVKKSNIRSNAPTRAPSDVKLRLTHAGRTATITRFLRPQKPATIKFDNETTEIVGEAEVTACVLSWLGVTDDLLNHVVCASQEDLFGFANMTSGARAKFFQALFGLEHLQTLRKKVQDFVSAFTTTDYDILLESIAKSVQQSLEDIEKLNLPADATSDLEQHAADTALVNYQNIQRVAGLIGDYQKAQSTVQELTTAGLQAKAELEAAQVSKLAAEAAFVAAQQAASNVDMLLKLHTDAERQQQALELQRQQLVLLESRVADASQRLAAAKENPAIQGIADPEQALKNLSQEWAVASARYQVALKAYQDYQSTPDVCPTCKQVVHKDAECVTDMQEELREATADYHLLTETHKTLENATRVVTQAERNHASLLAEWQFTNNAFQTAQATVATSQANILQPEALASLMQAKNALHTAAMDRDRASSNVDTIVANMNQLRTQYALWSQKVATVQADPLFAMVQHFTANPEALTPAINEASQIVTVARQLLQEKMQRIATRKAHVREVERLRGQELEIQAEKGKQAAVLAKYEQLRDVCALLHSDAVPKYIATQNLEILQMEMNRVLQELSAKFRLKAEDDLTLVAMFPDGREQPLSRLSGGQKTVVAAVFRIAMSTVFTSNIGFLVLDEPTAFQDREHIEGLIPALEALERYAENTGMQLLVVTHEPLLHPVFKRLIDLSA
jgi:DNA repair exonuclease SbcCD ATPase subunit